MNRIILIGNGFDLAHGLETSYSHFIDDFWKNKINEIRQNISQNHYEDNFIVLDKIRHAISYEVTTFKQLRQYESDLSLKIKFNNFFLESISDKSYEKWVDIESEYFSALLKIITDGYNIENRIKKLNEDFESIKLAFENYLKNILQKKDQKLGLNQKIHSIIYSEVKLNDFSKKGVDCLYSEELSKINSEFENINKNIPNKYNYTYVLAYAKKQNDDGSVSLNEKNFIDLFNSKNSEIHLNLGINNMLLLNFNYTPLEKMYLKSTPECRYQVYVDSNHIHGEIDNEVNKIIFGYGDEISPNYKKIEDLDSNIALENVKSIKYLDTDNYKKLLEFLDTDKYQIFILGHSCGISDRTLLSTLFENDNCVSIKFFYHKVSEDKDNYRNIIQNISRNFNDKKMMREKVVNKTYCDSIN